MSKSNKVKLAKWIMLFMKMFKVLGSSETGRQADRRRESQKRCADRQIFRETDRRAGRHLDRQLRSTIHCHTSLESGIVPNSRLPARSAPLAAS